MNKIALRLSIFAFGAFAGAYFWTQSTNDAILSGQSLAIAAPAKKAAPPKGAKAPSPAPAVVFKAATPAQKAAAQKSINLQLAAFKRGDWPDAVRYQSTVLKRNFPSNAAFQSMMETNYPQFVSSRKVVFGRAIAGGNRVQIEVKVTGTDGVVVECAYLMVKESGVYKVEGVAGGLATPTEPGLSV